MKITKCIAVVVLTVLALPVVALAATPSSPTLNPVDQELLVSGLTDNNTEVVVYIDDEFIGMATVLSEVTETDNYSFSVAGLLEKGDHTVSVAAKNKQSLSLSSFSQIETFFVSEENSLKPKTIEPSISIEAAVEEVENVEQVASEKTEEKELIDINELVVEEEEMSEEDKKKNESILRWNLAIFIFFLVAVIAWIIWVNRELKKEKEAEENNK